MLFEDLRLLKDEEWQIVLPAVRMNDLAIGLSGKGDMDAALNQEILDQVKRNFADRTRQIFEETMTYQNRVTKAQVEESQDRIMASLKGLIEKKKISDPLARAAEEPKQLEPPQEAAHPA